MGENTTITVEKRVEIDTYEAPAIVYELTCSTDEQTHVRLRDEIPDEFSPGDLGFHQQYHADKWWVGDDEIVFETPIDPDEQLTTVVGVRTSDPTTLRSLRSRPTFEIASPGSESDRSWGEVSDAIVQFEVDDTALAPPQTAATDGGEVSHVEEPPSERTDDLEEDGAAAPDGSDTGEHESNDIESAIPSVPAAQAPDAPAETGWDPDSEELVQRFVDELASDSLSESQRRRLQEALGVDTVSSMDARIEHCQKQLSDLSAYVDALETFLDEEGSGQELIHEFRDDVAAVESQVAALETELDETADGQQDLRERVDEIEDEMASLRAVREDVTRLESRFDEETTELRGDIEDLRAAIDQLREWQSGVVSAFEDIQSIES